MFLIECMSHYELLTCMGWEHNFSLKVESDLSCRSDISIMVIFIMMNYVILAGRLVLDLHERANVTCSFNLVLSYCESINIHRISLFQSQDYLFIFVSMETKFKPRGLHAPGELNNWTKADKDLLLTPVLCESWQSVGVN